MEDVQKDRQKLLDDLSRTRKEQAGICVSTCRSVVYSIMAAAWAFWIYDDSMRDGLLVAVFSLGCLYLMIETGICYYSAQKADKYYKRTKITCIPMENTLDKMSRLSDFSFKKLIFQMMYCLCLVVLFVCYLFKFLVIDV